ncbi:hypothetical protein BJX70DRAFT_400108 [Aspergillus crustosus]
MGEYIAPEAQREAPCLQELNGVWVLEKHLSSNIPSILKLQRIPFLLRKAITSPSTPIHLHITTYKTLSQDTTEPKIHLDHVQRTPGLGLGLIPVIEDKRVLDWVEGLHEDVVFGKVRTRSRLVFGSDRSGVGVCLAVGEGREEEVGKFLRGDVGVDCNGAPVVGCNNGSQGETGAEGEDEGNGTFWVQTLEINDKAGWSAETIWGYEVVNGERHLTSRVMVVDRKGNYQLGRCVFRFLERKHCHLV